MFATQRGSHVFTFDVPNEGETELTAIAGGKLDSIRIRRTDVPNPVYTLPGQEIVNWLDREVLPQPEGFCSVYDTVGTLCATGEGLAFLKSLMNEGNGTNIHVPFDETMQHMMRNETLASIVIRRSKADPKEQLKKLNSALNRIRKAS